MENADNNEKIVGKIVLNGFSLDESEKAIVENIVKNYKHKISERGDFEYVQLRMRKRRKGKTFRHEIEGKMKAGQRIYNSKSEDFNLFAAIDEALDKLLNEMIHKQRTARQIK